MNQDFCYKVNFCINGEIGNIRRYDISPLITPREYHRYLATEKLNEYSFVIVTEIEQDWDGYPHDVDEKYGVYVEREIYFNDLEAAKKYAEDKIASNIKEYRLQITRLEENLKTYKIEL